MSERVTFDPPREITFEEIRKGDEIEVQESYDGLLKSVRAIAHHRVDFQRTTKWYTETDWRLVSSDDLDYRTRLLLHSRLASDEPTGLGAVVCTDEGDEYVSVNRVPGTPRWVDAGLHEGNNRWAFKWAEFDLDSIVVLSEGNEEES